VYSPHLLFRGSPSNSYAPVKVVSSRCLTPESELCRVHVTLVGIDLNYVWHTNSESTSNSLVHPFSTHLSLPFKMLLDNVTCRFFTWHLVRRYPLIFGPWCQQLDIERPYFHKIFRSISDIIARSPNPSFRKKCTRMLQVGHAHRRSPFESINQPHTDDARTTFCKLRGCGDLSGDLFWLV